MKASSPTWKNYIIEVPDLLYSLWGSLGSFDNQFCGRAGKNQSAICVALMATQSLIHASEWYASLLNSTVLWGDRYYEKSLNKSALNHLKLSRFIKAHSCVWDIEVEPKICGTLYGNSDLASTLESVLEKKSWNVLLECSGKSLAIIRTVDAYYAADPSWIGPPLFSRNRGALYVIRCKHFKALIYVVIKMINSNSTSEFTLTPVYITNFANLKANNKISEAAILKEPGKVMKGYGSDLAPDEDLFGSYRKSLISEKKTDSSSKILKKRIDKFEKGCVGHAKLLDLLSLKPKVTKPKSCCTKKPKTKTDSKCGIERNFLEEKSESRFDEWLKKMAQDPPYKLQKK